MNKYLMLIKKVQILQLRNHLDLVEAGRITLALSKAVPIKPLIRHYEKEGEPAYVKICCPRGCRVQLTGPNRNGKEFGGTHNYCPKCGQAIDWGTNDG